jgi:MerR family transcriptional regulator, light-induced transcriptional regulator
MERATRSTLSIGEIAVRTGVPTATLRSWESRYGFPRPTRLRGGHRRYSESDVDAVHQVLRRRAEGMALKAAVRDVTPDPFPTRSVFAELRRRHPHIAPQVLSKPSLVALSHAIEDECCARAARPLLFGGFQQEKHLRGSAARWTELARTARAAVAFAGLSRSVVLPSGRLVQVALPPDAPLAREWLVVCDAVDLPACMTAVELPGQGGQEPEDDRRFEMLWSVDPRVVRDASLVAQALADEYAPEWRPAGLRMADDGPPHASHDLGRASELFNRMLRYLETNR